jgi:hypothetical protein
VFIGNGAGQSSNGNGNTIVGGSNAGSGITTDSQLTMIGVASSRSGSTPLTDASGLGANVVLTASHDVQLGSPSVVSLHVGSTTLLDGAGGLHGSTFNTATNCSYSVSPAVCGSAAAGQVQIAAGATSIQINTTAVTANSRIGCLTYSTVGITAPTNIASLIQPYLSAVTAGTSFTLTVPVAPLTYPVNLQYCLIN